MVRTARQESDNEKLDRIITVQARNCGYEVYKSGWARITWEIFKRDPDTRDLKRVALVESFASTNGQIKICDPQATKFVEALGKDLEVEFPRVGEATIVEDYSK